MPDFSQNSKFNKYANFSSIKFGADAPLLETELNEMQDIQRERLRSFLKVHVGDGLYGVGTINYSDDLFTIENELALVNGNLITISRLEIEAVEGDSIYLQVKEKEVAYTDVLKKYGNEQETSTVPNQMYDERVNQETTRRVVETYTLSLTTDDEDSYYLKLGTITGGVFVNEVKSIKTGSISETERAYWNGKADVSYVDEQITLVTETGIPKLNVYEYKFPNLPAGTTEVEIPLETFDERTDTVKLYINSVYRDSDFYTISDKKIILNEALSSVSKVTIEVWKNVPIGDDGSVSGTVIAIDTLPQNRVKGLTTALSDIETNVGNVETEIALLNDRLGNAENNFNTHVENAITKSDLVQTTEVNDSTKIPSSAVTHGLSQLLANKEMLKGAGIVNKSTDFDGITQSGFYFYNSWAGNSSEGNNQPEVTGSLGFMFVFRITTSSHIVQVVFTNNKIHIRVRDASWEEWKSVALS